MIFSPVLTAEVHNAVVVLNVYFGASLVPTNTMLKIHVYNIHPKNDSLNYSRCSYWTQALDPGLNIPSLPVDQAMLETYSAGYSPHVCTQLPYMW